MASSRRIAVIGLGRFGIALARRLAMHGVDVIAIDSDAELVREISDEVSLAVRLDSTDEAALRSQEVDQVDACVVAIGENFEAALLTTVICKKNLHIPQVICRAQTRFHAQIFSQIGADEVIQPEQNAGDMLGRRLAHPRVNDYITLGEGFTVVELRAPTRFVGKTIREIDLRSAWSVNLIAIQRENAQAPRDDDRDGVMSTKLISVPLPEERIQASDVLFLAGSEEALARLPQ